jgi:hypothetical protein
LYNIDSFVIAMTIASAFTYAVVWPPFFQVIAYAFAQVGPDVGSILWMMCMLTFNVLTMRTLGLCLALLIPNGLTNTIVANLFAQLCMLTNGFYTNLPDWFQPITVISIPRYTLKALLKLEFSYLDGFEVDPMSGVPAWGFPTKYIPAQLTGAFLTMHQRQMDIMRSFQSSDCYQEIMYLIIFTCAAQFFFTLGLLKKIRSGETARLVYEASQFQIFSVPLWMADGDHNQLADREATHDLIEHGESKPTLHSPTTKSVLPSVSGKTPKSRRQLQAEGLEDEIEDGEVEIDVQQLAKTLQTKSSVDSGVTLEEELDRLSNKQVAVAYDSDPRREIDV